MYTAPQMSDLCHANFNGPAWQHTLKWWAGRTDDEIREFLDAVATVIKCFLEGRDPGEPHPM